MDLAKRDQQIELLRDLLNDRQQFIKDRRNELQQSSKENEYLNEVVLDYNDYYDKIKDEKLNQIAALQNLSEYISQMSNKDDTEGLIAQSKIQQKQIHDEINSLKKELTNLD